MDHRLCQLPLEAAKKYPAALEIVRDRVKPVRETNNRAGIPEILVAVRRGASRDAQSRRRALAVCSGYPARKRLLWFGASRGPWRATRPYLRLRRRLRHGHPDLVRPRSLGKVAVLDARRPASVHALHQSFMTFPWPDPVRDEQRKSIGEVARNIIERRQAICAGRVRANRPLQCGGGGGIPGSEGPAPQAGRSGGRGLRVAEGSGARRRR